MPKYLSHGSPSAYPQVAYAEPTETVCRSCGQPLKGDIWLIIVVADDVPELIYNHTLQTLVCKHCGAATIMDAPLLVCRLGFYPPLIFSPASTTTAEEDSAACEWLLDIVKSQIGTLWDDGWLGDSRVVPRPELAATIRAIQGKPPGLSGLRPDVVRVLLQGAQNRK
jgi:ribosomal protein L40E